MRQSNSVLVGLCITIAANAHAGETEWITFADETSQRLPVPPNDPLTSVLDAEEKAYAWGDVDRDGDLDLVVARKQPWDSTGKRINVLFMNEGMKDGHAMNGVLIDRTAAYATASDVEGDMGFLTPTNDRGVVLVDVNGDEWLDIVTATTLSDFEPTHISHPRVYINLGEEGGAWLGFKYENARIPQMHPTASPRFAEVCAADLTGDGAPDLFFPDGDLGGPEVFDFGNKLLINDGSGFFTDESDRRLPEELLTSGLFNNCALDDMNGDGAIDIINNRVGPPFPNGVGIAYNASNGSGFFDTFDVLLDTSAPTAVSSGDLNFDGAIDIAVTNDFTDRILLNQGGERGEFPTFLSFLLPPATNGFGGNPIIADLDADDWPEIIVPDVDYDIPGCARTSDILRNNADGPVVTFTPDFAGIPADLLKGVHDVAAFDLNGDDLLDLVVGRCNSTSVWIQQTREADCPADLDGSGDVGFADLLALLNMWSAVDSLADLDGDGSVGFEDLLILLAAWGACA